MNNPSISLCMIVKNESKNLARCLDSVHSIVDEIIIVDTGSEDNTREIALSYGANVYEYEWCDDFASARNFAISYARGEWILSLDADEEINLTVDLSIYLKSLSHSILCNMIYRYQIFSDSDEFIEDGYYFRLFRRDQDLSFRGRLHEQLFYKNRPLFEHEINSLSNERIFIKHYGDADGNSLKKCREFYIPMLERIASKEPLSWMLMYYLYGYYRDIGEIENSLQCREQVVERLLPHIISGKKPLDFVFIPTWLITLCQTYFMEEDLESLFAIVPRSLQWCDKSPHILNLVGRMLYSLELYLAAIPYLQASLDCYINRTYNSNLSCQFETFSTSFDFLAIEAFYLQGCCYIALNRLDEAVISLEKCLSTNCEFSDAREKIINNAREKILLIRENIDRNLKI